MPFLRKYQIPREVLEKVARKELGLAEVGRMYGCGRSTVRSQVKEMDRKPTECRASHIEPGIGGDAKFDRLMGERRFTECPRAKRDYGSRERLPVLRVQYSSYSGCPTALACV